MRIVILTGSNRKEATSTKLGEYAAHIIRQKGDEAILFDLYKRPLPFYSPDETALEHEHLSGLMLEMLAADAIVLVTPEYHGSISGVLKNALDHLGQAHFNGKVVLAASSAGGAVGVSSLLQLQAIVRNLHGVNAPDWISIGGLQRKRFEAGYDGYEGGQDIEDRIHLVIESFLNLARKLSRAI
ncbi:NAD(P)H-dependent oxidoreductase [Paenibacillus albidus]|uniref:NADPH-dependent FMN reductase n=1 Tax=Paenibacillus albidus TaxID=2041023 RepID=UPI001BECE2D0|nr:NADPH-dependent FMN reductase [Paenibacillus albidus]MBT2287707.1 NAD(P)H-dependent oxidoreductase [Paenibacillus albidus]